MNEQQNKGILLLNEEFDQVKESGKLQKILNMKWELKERYSELIQLSNELSFKRQHKAQQKVYKEAEGVYEIIRKTEELLK